jgi:hypothetical protein
VGDAINANPMPKSAFVANNQAKACAAAVLAGLRGEPPPPVFIANTCYSLVAEDYAISISGLYRANGERWVAVDGSVGTSPTGASGAIRAQEARYAFDWYQTIVADTFG